MGWGMWLFRWCVAALLIVGSGYAVARHLNDLNDGRYGELEVLKPTATPRALVIVFPDVAAPARARVAAQQLVAAGALVAVVDTASYLHNVAARPQMDCTRLADDAERLGKQLLRGANAAMFQPPLLLGDGQGALLVRQAIAAAAPDVLAGAVVVGGTSSEAHLACAARTPSHEQGVLAVVPQAASAAQLAQVSVAHFPLAGTAVAALPLLERPVPGSHRLAILISGDGGWRELDKGICAELNRQGVSVVGWNSLRYFWHSRSPAQIATDLAQVLDSYRRRWHIEDVALVGYSFGADVMPFAYERLSPAQREQISFVSLLGLAHAAEFKVRVGGWLGLDRGKSAPILPELTKMPPTRLQCIYGEQEKDTLCPELARRGIEAVARPGGHHFDHDPVRLARIVLQGWRQRSPALS